MKTLVFVRHAKSSWDNPGLSDFERPLNKRGKNDAPFMAKLIASKGIKPDIIYSSPAKRAYTTCKHFAKELNYPKDDIIRKPLIYEYGPNDILRMVEKSDDRNNVIFVFGHNPDTTHMVNFLSGEHIGNVPTCGVACIDFDTDRWDNIREEKGKLRFFEFPKKYPDRDINF